MLYAADVGHAYFKGIGNNKKAFFPAVLGEIQTQLMGGHNGYLQIETRDGKYLVGEGAIEQSLNQIRGQDRGWAKTSHWRTLLLTGISETVSSSTSDLTVDIVSGLPVADFSMREEVAVLLRGVHQIKRPNRRNLTVEIRNVLFVPQALAAFDGTVSDGETLVVLDIGGRNINFSTFTGKHAIAAKCGSTETGMLVTTQQITRRIKERTGRDLYPHQTIEVMKSGVVKAYGETYDVNDIVDEELEMFTASVFSLISSVWRDTNAVDVFCVAGGGAAMIGNRIARRYRQARVVDDPQWANVNGYLRFGKMKFGA